MQAYDHFSFVVACLCCVVLCCVVLCCGYFVVLCTTEPPYKTTWWRTVSIYLNICSMSIMSKEQISMWTQRPLHTLLKHTLSFSQDSYLDNTHLQLFVCWLQKCYPNRWWLLEASFPRQMLAVGFITVIMCFLLLCFFQSLFFFVRHQALLLPLFNSTIHKG